MSDLAAILHRAIQRWNDGNLSGYLDLYDDAIRLHGYSPEPMDKKAVQRFYEAVWSALGDRGRSSPALHVHEVLSEGDLLACRFTMSGVHRGEFLCGALPSRWVAGSSVAIRNPPRAEGWRSATFADQIGRISTLVETTLPRTGRLVRASPSS